MNTEFFIAKRYLRSKNKKFFSLSTTIAIGGVFVGVAALLITLSMMNGFQNELRRRILGGTPHVVVQRFFNEPLLEHKDVLQKLVKYSFVKGAAPFIYQKSIIKFKRRLDGVVVKGVHPELERNITDIERKIVDGVYDLERGCIIGTELAHSLKVSVGDTLIIASPYGDQLGLLPRVKKLVLKGIFNFGYYDYDATFVFMDLKNLQALYQMDNQVSGIELRVDDVYRSPHYARIIEKDLGHPYRVKDWIQSNRSVFAALKMEKIITFIVLTLIILVAGFNIVGTLVNMVKKKTAEIGVLRSYGFTSGKIMKIFIYHGCMIGLIGTGLGLVFAFIACWILDKYRVGLPGDVYFIATLPVEMSVNDFMVTAFAAIMISFIATIYPAKKATQLTTVEALRNE
jgi:lipoprotein-releasing system permease protein